MFSNSVISIGSRSDIELAKFDGIKDINEEHDLNKKSQPYDWDVVGDNGFEPLTLCL